jgi:hypothetical protein
MLLSRRSEEKDVLQVLAATRREVRLETSTKEPVRKPASRQAKRLRSISATFREDLASQLGRREPFRGRVAVRLDMRVPPMWADVGFRRTVKEQIDLLRGLVFADDAAIDHLEVHRHVTDDESCGTRFQCLPLTTFCCDFDRAFRLSDELGIWPPRDDAQPGLMHFEHELLRYERGILALLDELDAEEQLQLEEDEDAFVCLDVPSSYPEFHDREVRDSTRAHLEASIASALGHRLCDQALDSRDRPGPSPAWRQEAHDLDTADVVFLADVGPGCFVVPPPPVQTQRGDPPTWPAQVARVMARQRTNWGMHAIKFPGVLSLDIAFRGGCADHADVDNLAHSLVAAFEAAWAGRDTPDIGGYRAYRLEGDSRDVRIRVMTQDRLLTLHQAMERGREFVRRERPRRRRAALD